MHRKDNWAVVAYLIPTVGLLLQGLLYVTPLPPLDGLARVRSF
jgi:hypothetical protein